MYDMTVMYVYLFFGLIYPKYPNYNGKFWCNKEGATMGILWI